MIKIINYDKHPITLIGRCVGQCYGSDTSDPVKNYKRGKQCIEDGHGRVLEYASVIMELDEYSIKVMREFYTHIGGLPTRTQESTRYVNMQERGYFTPPKIDLNDKAYGCYEYIMGEIWDAYERLVGLGIPKEDASMVLPLGMNTKVVVKMNARTLLDMAQVRMCTRAYHEYRKLMNEIKELLSGLDTEWAQLADMMKPKCEVVGFCTEHYSCGRKPKKDELNNVKKNYDELKKQYHELELKCNELQEKADMYDEHMARCSNDETDYWKDRYAELNKSHIELQTMNRNLNDEVDRLRDMLAELDYKNRDLKNHISELYDEHILKGAEKEFGDI